MSGLATDVAYCQRSCFRYAAGGEDADLFMDEETTVSNYRIQIELRVIIDFF
jgi:hypothetical protein